ncbi:hypothetical protein D0X99_11875 [Algoriphagus lacus]|uniref:Outer membrane protein beta-barrel domain-containing protein n=1 Tax=Algoriphagus lacus TaxID=2056311 RepID=A0A418PRF8_9BACT|nr:hypothetical protein [Algoriphagus lacus]RIW15138.1 hypothetical protein D0X99_11875 [Algoriphagus lacus]
MQEDNPEKWLASSLRKQQEENPLPYELGAWEAFEAKRAAAVRKRAGYWITGVAASLALLWVAGSVWISQDLPLKEEPLIEQLASNQQETQLESNALDQEIPNADRKEESVSESLSSGRNEESIKTPKDQISSGQKQKSINSNPVSPEPKNSDNLALIEKSSTEEIGQKAEAVESLIAQAENPKEEIPSKAKQDQAVVVQELPTEPQLSEEEIQEILETKSFARLAMGLSPGFGTSQGTEQTTSGSSLGLGVLVDMDLPGKLTLGSGLAVNYLNQASESQSYAQVAGFSSPVTQSSEISQIQLDIPLFVKYPLTRSQSISVQAGFSNLMTFNQNAEQQSSYTRQVAVLDASAESANSFTLKSEAVSQVSALDVPENRFYPFATANFGVNVRLYQSKKTSYEVMPFYNYPLQEFSGYGEKLGMFGASFKVNFGAVQKK